MDPKLIACRVMIEDARPFLPANVATEVFDISLHSRPPELRAALQRAIDEADGKYDPIFLAYGMCGQGLVGLTARHSRLVVPKADDCIGIFLGSQQAYRQELANEPGTYFLTQGWIGDGTGTLFADFDRVAAKYGPARAEKIVGQMLRHYRRLLYIRTPRATSLDTDREYCQQMAERFHLQYVETEGTSQLLERMFSGDWREDFVILQPGQTIAFEQFVSK